jgi:hypothetical protein
LLEKFISAAADHDGEMEYIADALEALHFQGLEPDEAPAVWAAVTAMAMGGVSEGHRERVHAEQGRPWLARIFAVTARSAPIEFPTLRAIARSGYDPFSEDAFQQRLTLLFEGIAVQYGLPAESGRAWPSRTARPDWSSRARHHAIRAARYGFSSQAHGVQFGPGLPDVVGVDAPCLGGWMGTGAGRDHGRHRRGVSYGSA